MIWKNSQHIQCGEEVKSKGLSKKVNIMAPLLADPSDVTPNLLSKNWSPYLTEDRDFLQKIFS